MKKKTIQFCSCLTLFLLLTSCGETAENTTNTTTETTTETTSTTEASTTSTTKNSNTVYAWVDKLRLRENPTLSGKEVVQVAEGTAMTFNGEISPEKFKIKLRGREIEAPFYKVKTKEGKEGWVFAGALSNNPVDVQNYRVAFAFDDRKLSDDEESGDFSYYLYEAGQELIGTGVELIYVDEKFHEVQIKNGKGEIIGVETISSFVKEHGTGIVCFEKGKAPKYVDFSPEMAQGIKDVFGVK